MTIDRRIRKSQVAMRNAFIELLHQHQLEEITVQQIADLADVNRSTFYTHYYDKYDLLEKLEDQQLEEIRDFIHDEKLNGAVKLSTDIHQNYDRFNRNDRKRHRILSIDVSYG